MESSNNSIGFYWFIENIKNFKIKVKVRKAFSSYEIRSNLLESDDNEAREETWDEKVIEWQEKLFSKEEISYYSENRTYESFIEKRYHSMVQNLPASKKHWMKIITITDTDLALKGNTEKYKRDKSQMMIVKLQDLENGQTHVLCQIKANIKKGTLIIEPNFNSFSHNSYLISAQDKFGGAKIEYSIENGSLQLSREERRQKFLLMMKLNKSTKVNQLMDLNLPLKLESKGVMIYAFGEIELAKNFRDNIHLEYWIDLPKEWLAANGQQLFGLTQKCYPNYNNVVYFGAPFSFNLLFSQSDQMSLNQIESPRLCFRVVSSDYLKKEKTQGFGVLLIPLCSGKFLQTVSTYRPVSSTLTDTLNDYFLGLDFDIDDIEKSNHQPIGHIFSESTGTIQINLNVILQSNQYYSKIDQVKYDYEFFENNIASIIAAFRKAKQKILELKLHHLDENLSFKTM